MPAVLALITRLLGDLMAGNQTGYCGIANEDYYRSLCFVECAQRIGAQVMRLMVKHVHSKSMPANI